MTWTIQKARDTYNIAHWSNGYFDINDHGQLVCRPDPRAAHPRSETGAPRRRIDSAAGPQVLPPLKWKFHVARGDPGNRLAVLAGDHA